MIENSSQLIKPAATNEVSPSRVGVVSQGGGSINRFKKPTSFYRINSSMVKQREKPES